MTTTLSPDHESCQYVGGAAGGSAGGRRHTETADGVHAGSAHQVKPRAGSCASARSGSRDARRHFLRHYLEMVLAMVAGMVGLGAVASGLEAIGGLEFPNTPEFAALAMAVAMAAAMVVWMRYRGHAWPGTLEMAGAMFAPVLGLMPLLWLGVLGGDAFLILEHVVMLPLMYVVMHRRRTEYGG